MTALKFAHELNMAMEECCNCGIPFAMTTQLQQEYKRNHAIFYCPKGHQQYYSGKSDEEKLQDQVAALENKLQNKQKEKEWAEQATRNAKNQARAQKGAKTKLKNRIKNGVCPCCTRTFANVSRHMANQHPEYQGESI